VNRRAFLTTLAVATAVAPAVARAQPSGHGHRIGWLARAPNLDNMETFLAGLRAVGLVEGTNLTIEPRYAGGALEALGMAAAELVRSNPGVIVTDGSSAAAAAKRATATIPIVFVSGDPVGMGLIPRLSQPGGNMTGLAIISTELNVKRLELLRESLPRVSRVGVLYEPRQRAHMIPPLEAGARSLGFQLLRLEAGGADDIDAAVSAAVRERVAVVMPVASAHACS